MKKKACNKCEVQYPINPKHWFRASNNKDGLMNICKPCNHEYYLNRKDREPVDEVKEVKVVKLELEIFDIDKCYLVTKSMDGRKEDRTFKGRAIYQDKRLLTLRNDNGTTESFLKVDFAIGEYSCKSI